MKCNKAQENISQYYDGQLKKEDWQELKGHLAKCSDCLQVFQKMAKLSEQVKKLNVPFKPTTIPNTILKRRPFQFKLAAGVSVAFALIALAIGISTLRPLELDNKSLSSKEELLKINPKLSVGSYAGSNYTNKNKKMQLIQKIVLTIRVFSVVDAFEKVTNIIESSSGYIANSNLAPDKAQKRGTKSVVVTKVPVNRLQDTKAKIRNLGDAISEKVDTEDVSLALVDLQANLRNYQRQENRYLQLIDRANSIRDLERLESKLAEVRQSIEQTQGEIKYHKGRVAMATLTVNLAKRAPKTPNWLMQTIINSWNNFAAVSRALISTIFWLLPFALVGLIGYGAYKLIRNRI